MKFNPDNLNIHELAIEEPENVFVHSYERGQQRVFKTIDGIDFRVDDSVDYIDPHYGEWHVGQIINRKKEKTSFCRAEIINSKKLTIIGFAGFGENKIIVTQLDGGKVFCEFARFFEYLYEPLKEPTFPQQDSDFLKSKTPQMPEQKQF